MACGKSEPTPSVLVARSGLSSSVIFASVVGKHWVHDTHSFQVFNIENPAGKVIVQKLAPSLIGVMAQPSDTATHPPSL